MKENREAEEIASREDNVAEYVVWLAAEDAATEDVVGLATEEA